MAKQLGYKIKYFVNFNLLWIIFNSKSSKFF